MQATATLMQEVSIDEPLGRVFVLFEKGRIQPLELEWKNRRWKVRRVNSNWVDRSLRPHRHGFSLTMESGEIFQVCYEESNPVWKLEYILTD